MPAHRGMQGSGTPQPTAHPRPLQAASGFGRQRVNASRTTHQARTTQSQSGSANVSRANGSPNMTHASGPAAPPQVPVQSQR